MYRCVGLATIEQGVAVSDTEQVTALAQAAAICFLPDAGGQRVLLNGVDVTEAIRTPEASQRASQVAAIPGVRQAMVAQQRQLGAAGNVVMEGRDIGTVVFPQAEVKVFLTASEPERVQRRLGDLQAQGRTISAEELQAEMAERDTRDSRRADSPLVPAKGARLLLTDGLTVDEVVTQIATWVKEGEDDA
jgi:cytidylate kinase